MASGIATKVPPAPVTEPHVADAIFLTWFSHRRTTSIGRELGIPVIEIVTHLRHVFRYAELTVRTVAFLAKRRPPAIVAQSPSLVLVMLLLALRPIFRFRLIVDAHNESVVPFQHSSALFLRATAFCLRHADLTIVTNEELIPPVRAAGGRAFVLPDPLPSPPDPIPGELFARPYWVVVCTFAPDEPLRQIFSAAARSAHLPVYVTGNDRRLSAELRASLPPNVHLTGYLSDGDYWSLLAHSSGIIDLTDMANCLVCGAYEAMAVGVPMILTDNSPTRRLFGHAAILVHNNEEEIFRALQRLALDPEASRGAEPARQYMRTWRQSASRLLEHLQSRPQ